MFLDKNAEIEMKTGGNLPHWHQCGKVQFVTFRLADSLPTTVLRTLNEAVTEFKQRHAEPWDMDTRRQYWKLIGPMEERLLSNSHGSCVLRHSNIRTIVSDALKFNAGIAYDLLAYVIMPNHVHLLIRPYDSVTLSRIMHSIKRFSANRINKALHRSGMLWMPESYDRIVRSADELRHYVDYIRKNPKYLRYDEFELFVNDNFSEYI